MKHSTFLRNILLISSACLLAAACGKKGNLFEKAYTPSAKEKAQQNLESGDCEAAQSDLTSYLEESPSDTEAKQIYYNAVTACLDLGMDSIITKLSNPSEAGGDMSKLIQMMPEATQENVDKLQRAVDALKSIPADQRTSEQNAQLAIASMSVAATTAKMVASNPDGSYNKEKAAAMTDAQADSVVTNLQTASEALSASGSTGSQTESISNVNSGISNSSGGTSREKLTNYLQTH